MKRWLLIGTLVLTGGCGVASAPAHRPCPDGGDCAADGSIDGSGAQSPGGDVSPVRPIPSDGADDGGIASDPGDVAVFDPPPPPTINPFPFDPSIRPIVISPGSAGFYENYLDQLLLDLMTPYGELATESYLERLCLDSDLPESYCRQRYGR
jgi:hypothetical protein